jgi:hypothetical protein
MSDPDPDDTSESMPENPPDATETEANDESAATDASNRGPVDYLELGALALFSLLGAIAALMFYVSASSALNEFVTPTYQPVFQAGFNLVILLGAAIGISLIVRHRYGRWSS